MPKTRKQIGALWSAPRKSWQDEGKSYDCFRNILREKPRANTPRPMLMSNTTGGSGTACASVVLVVVVFDNGPVVACVGPTSELCERLEKASEVAGRARTVRSRNNEL